MMSEPSTVDRTTVDELTGKIVLLIEEDRPWDETSKMLRQLSAKVRHYVRFIRSQQFVSEHGQRPQDTIVRLISAQPPSEESSQFFRRIGYELNKNGIDFEFQLGDEGIPVAVTPDSPLPEVSAHGPPTTPAVGRERPPGSEGERPPPAETVELEPEVEPPTVSGVSETPAEPEPAGASGIAEPAGVAPQPADEEAEAPPVAPESDDWEPAVMEEPSELELLIEASEDEAEEIIGLAELPEPAARAESATPADSDEQTYPPFFPEEEFGRALPEPDEMEALLGSSALGPTIIETSSGKQIVLDAGSSPPAKRRRGVRENGARPSTGRAIGAAIGAAIAGAVLWAALAVPAQQGASPLAVAVALMVGMSVRLRGAGGNGALRMIGCLGTMLGSLLGVVLAVSALTFFVGGAGIDGVIELFTQPAKLWTAINEEYQPLDLISLALALYVAFKISASKQD